MAIPKIIHYVWLGGKEKPELFYRCLESWKKYCPDWEIKEWNESNFDFNESLYARQSYELKKYGFVPDYIRAKVLYEYGGVYLDTDVELTKTLDELIDNDFLISFENEVHVETAVLASSKNHPFAKIMSTFYLDYPYIYNGKPDLTPSTPIWTYFLKKYYGFKLKNSKQVLNSLIENDSSTVTVLPYEYFSPINYTTKVLTKTENTYAIHYFNATWFTGKLKKQEKFLKNVHKIFGKKIFACFTKSWVKSVFRKLSKRIKKYNIDVLSSKLETKKEK